MHPKNLGRWLLPTLLPLFLWGAGVNLTLQKPAIYAGDTATFTIEAQGNDIQLPNIADVEGFPILGSSSGSTIEIINGVTTKKLSRSYSFAPTRDLTLPSFTVHIDGKPYVTEPKNLKVLTPKAGAAGDPYLLEMKLEKQVAYVGEPVILHLTFKQRLDAKLDQIEMGEPNLEGFWVKKVQGVENGVEGEYATQSYRYVLFPKKAGSQTIPAVTGRAGVSVRRGLGGGFFNDPFFAGMQMQWQKLFSNSATLEVKALPEDAYLYGDFTLEAKIDSTQAEANKPIHLTLRIEGSGNIDDIAPFALEIPGTALYADAPKIETSLQGTHYMGSFTQKIAIVADRDFTIPALSLRYFDSKQHKLITRHTQPIPITIKGALPTPAPTLQSNTPLIAPPSTAPATPLQPWHLALGGVLGMILGALGVWLALRPKKTSTPKETPLGSAIKATKDDKALFALLLPYAKENPALGATLAQLEENLYRKGAHKIDKKALLKAITHV